MALMEILKNCSKLRHTSTGTMQDIVKNDKDVAEYENQLRCKDIISRRINLASHLKGGFSSMEEFTPGGSFRSKFSP